MWKKICLNNADGNDDDDDDNDDNKSVIISHKIN